MIPFPIPQTLLAKGLALAILVILVSGFSAFATYRYVQTNEVAPLQAKIAEYKAKDEAKTESVASDSEASVEEAAKQAEKRKVAVDLALAEYKKRNGAAGAQRPCLKPIRLDATVGPLPPPEGTNQPSLPEVEILEYQVLSDDGLYTAQKILGQVPPRSTPLEDGSHK